MDSQSPWIHVDQVPGANLSIWVPTGDVYETLPDGSVALDRLLPKEVKEDSQVSQEGRSD